MSTWIWIESNLEKTKKDQNQYWTLHLILPSDKYELYVFHHVEDQQYYLHIPKYKHNIKLQKTNQITVRSIAICTQYCPVGIPHAAWDWLYWCIVTGSVRLPAVAPPVFVRYVDSFATH